MNTSRNRVLTAVAAAFLGIAVAMGTTGCVDKADTASYNLSRQADKLGLRKSDI